MELAPESAVELAPESALELAPELAVELAPQLAVELAPESAVELAPESANATVSGYATCVARCHPYKRHASYNTARNVNTATACELKHETMNM